MDVVRPSSLEVCRVQAGCSSLVSSILAMLDSNVEVTRIALLTKKTRKVDERFRKNMTFIPNRGLQLKEDIALST
jgi:hypothetical protein